ncbi:hypothetical protein WAI453_011391 [Rhynchosporium graminicola]
MPVYALPQTSINSQKESLCPLIGNIRCRDVLEDLGELTALSLFNDRKHSSIRGSPAASANHASLMKPGTSMIPCPGEATSAFSVTWSPYLLCGLVHIKTTESQSLQVFHASDYEFPSERGKYFVSQGYVNLQKS